MIDVEAIRAGAQRQLSGADLEDEDLSKANLSGFVLSGANLMGDRKSVV